MPNNNNDPEVQALVEKAVEAYEHYTDRQPDTTDFAYIQAGARDEVQKNK